MSVSNAIDDLKKIFEDKDPFDSVSDKDLTDRGVDPVASAYASWAMERGLRNQVAEVFGKYMEARWGRNHLKTPYGEEWMERFRNGAAYGKSDGEGQRILKSLGVKKGVDARGYITDHYSVDEASKYRIQQTIQKKIDMSPDDLPYTYEDITQLPEYQEIVSLPYVTDVTTPLQKSRRAVTFEFNGRNIVEARDPFDSVDPEDLQYRQKRAQELEKIIKRNEDLENAEYRLDYALKPRRYTTHANGYVRYGYGGTWGNQTTGVLHVFDPALHLDDYRRLLVRIKQTFDRKVVSIAKRKANYQEYLALRGITEAEERDPFDSVSPEDIKKREDAYLKSIRAESGSWDDIAKAELEQMLECETDFGRDNGSDYIYLECINGTKGNNGESEWIVYQDESCAEDAALEYVQDMIEGDPGSFNLEQYITMSDTDRRMFAQEEADYQAEDMSDDDVISEADAEDEIEELQNKIDELLDSEDPPDDWRGQVQKYEDEKQDIIDRAREDVIEKIYDRIYDELYDPVDYFVNIHGMYSIEDLAKSNLVSVDFEDAARDFVSDDGVARWLDFYDEDAVELPSGALAYGRN